MANLSGPLRTILKRNKGSSTAAARHTSVSGASTSTSTSTPSSPMPQRTGMLLSRGSDDDVFASATEMLASPAPATLNTLTTVEEDERKLDEVTKLLERCNTFTTKIVGVLESFEERIAEVEAGILPVHRVTSRLRTTYGNVSASIVAVDHVLSYFQLEAKLEAAIREGPHGDLASFLETLAKLDEALAFFDSHTAYKSSEATLRKLRQLRATGLDACEKLYVELLERASAAREPSSFPAPLPKELELLGTVEKERLLMLSDVLAESPTLTREFVESRARFFLGTMRKIPFVTGKLGSQRRDKAAEGATPSMARITATGDASVGQLQQAPQAQLQPSSAALGTAVLEGGDDDEAERRSFTELTVMFLRIAEHERRLTVDLFGDTLNVPVFAQVLEGAFDLYMRVAEATIKTRPKNVLEVERVFYLIDTYDDLSGKLKGLNQVTKVEGYTFNDRLNTLIELFRATVKQTLNAFLENVQRDKVKVGADGNVHPLSSRTLNYLIKRLLPKRRCLEFLVDKWLDVNTVTLEVIILTFCNELCINLEDKAKQVEKKSPTLANVFLLNNYHYILHTVSGNNLLPGDLLPTFVANYEQKIYHEIAKYRASWNQALEWLLDVNKAQIVTSDYKQIKAKFSGFNKALEKLFHTQKTYTIPNNNLRQELRELAKSAAVPLYRNFLQRYADVPFSKNRGKYERYSCETLDAMLEKFFAL